MSQVMPLEGIRILDMGRVFAAPFCTQLLGDLGAEVIKVERPGVGDDFRQYAPPFVRDQEGRETSESAQFQMVNRNKRSVAIDFSKPEGQDLIRRLAVRCDVLVENYKVGNLGRYGLDYESLSKVNDKLIYCSITGFGQTGPYASRPATDSVFQAMSGLMSVTGEPDQPPQKVGVVISDLIAGLYAASAIQAAIRHREINGGKGQHIDLALLDTSIAAMAQRSVEFLIDGQVPQRLGSASLGSAPAQTFRCRDGYISVQAGSDDSFASLCELLDLKDLLEDTRFSSRAERFRNIADLLPPIKAALLKRDSTEWYEEMVARNIICAPIFSVDQTFSDPQVQHRMVRRTMAHSKGAVPTLANPINFSDTPIMRYDAAPMLGEHSEEILSGMLGLSATQIEELRRTSIL